MKPFKPFRFLDWKVYGDAQRVFWEIRRFVTTLPKEYRFEIGSQVIRSSLSVVLNIAEGSGKFSPKELVRFLDITLGSLYETRATLDTVEKDPGIDSKIPEDIFSKIDEVGKQLGGLCRSIRKKE